MLAKRSGDLASKSDAEKIISEYHPSYWKYSWLFILWIPLLVAYGLGLILIIYAILAKKNTVYQITTRRIVVKQGIFARFHEEVSLPDIRAINVRQTIFQRMVNCGNISVVSAASLGAGYEAIQWIENPNDVREEISKLKLSKE